MAIDLIKSYLIGIGFDVDSNSAKDAETSIQITEEKIKKFNDNSKKGFSESGEAMKSLFNLFGSSNSIGRLFPELQKPLNGLLKDIKAVKKLYKDISKIDIKKKEDKAVPKKQINKKENRPMPKKETNKKEDTKSIPKSIKSYTRENNIKTFKKPKIKESKDDVKDDSGIDSRFKNLITNIAKAKKTILGFKKSSTGSLKEVESSTEALSVNGGKSLLKFSLKGAAHIGMFVAAVISAVALTKKIFSSLDELGKKDIEYEKFSRQLWTTKENARDVDSALKTLGVTMQDLWLSPTLLKQFNQLRKDSQQLRLPPEFKDNIKVIQGLGLEFKRLKQFGKLAFQWIGHYILKYVAGPLAEFKQKLSRFNDKFIKIIPYIAKVIGSAIGIILRILLLIFRVLEPIFSIVSKIIGFVIGLIDKIPGPIKKILKLIGVIVALLMAGPVGAIILIIALLDDLFTFLRGGKSVIGSVFGFFKEKGLDAMRSIKNKFGDLKESLKEKIKENGWDEYYENAIKVFEGIREKAKEVWGDIKEWSKGVWDKTKEFFTGSDVKSKVEVYNKDIKGSKAVAPNYTNSSNVSNNTTTANSNNKVNNTNTINVYGNNPNANANAIGKKLTGINTRNLQGVF
ncbi:hypothetical protein [Clostridium sporogenes]|uniref:hypothetical protein n=1 Tax=Clostridium sporogenes TaxID=1509 RepID=UPI00024BA46F|nr:hypothetical protein [Clostridium sporogenes]EHN17020.1 hypothetical protein IYC_00542 [Clostridium sporogenes PA 3679]NFQ35206.1 hypothetical protein [Clostridium sporogenes]NFQ60576.1 hypothetical protein [Clostridium sporogenes]NFU11137.1 hypothetical protein [Clostridium sporogenes]NFU43913.1 hypothetical protein [Clostridium sporogenes]